MSDWKPIETAPKDGTPVIIGWAGSDFHGIVAHYEDALGWVVMLRGLDVEQVYRPPTHWQPVIMSPPPAVSADSKGGG